MIAGTASGTQGLYGCASGRVVAEAFLNEEIKDFHFVKLIAGNFQEHEGKIRKPKTTRRRAGLNNNFD